MFERRLETPPGRQGRADLAFFGTGLADEPGAERVVRLLSPVPGHSRTMRARFAARQDPATVLRRHVAAFEAPGGAPGQVPHDRMQTAVPGEADERGIVRNPKLPDLAAHCGVPPIDGREAIDPIPEGDAAGRPRRGVPAPRGEGQGQEPALRPAQRDRGVERPFRYVRGDFFLARTFRNLDDLGAQPGRWLDRVANRRLHATAGRVVAGRSAGERPFLEPLPAGPFGAVPGLERRIPREGMIPVGGNPRSVPDGTRRRVVEVQLAATGVHVPEDGRRLAAHPALEGRGKRRIAEGRRTMPPANGTTPREGDGAPPSRRRGGLAAPGSLAIYDAVGRRLAARDAMRRAPPPPPRTASAAISAGSGGPVRARRWSPRCPGSGTARSPPRKRSTPRSARSRAGAGAAGSRQR